MSRTRNTPSGTIGSERRCPHGRPTDAQREIDDRRVDAAEDERSISPAKTRAAPTRTRARPAPARRAAPRVGMPPRSGRASRTRKIRGRGSRSASSDAWRCGPRASARATRGAPTAARAESPTTSPAARRRSPPSAAPPVKSGRSRRDGTARRGGATDAAAPGGPAIGRRRGRRRESALGQHEVRERADRLSPVWIGRSSGAASTASENS